MPKHVTLNKRRFLFCHTFMNLDFYANFSKNVISYQLLLHALCIQQAQMKISVFFCFANRTIHRNCLVLEELQMYSHRKIIQPTRTIIPMKSYPIGTNMSIESMSAKFSSST